MSYLLIDLEKSIAPLHEISLMAGGVFLFAKRKRHRRLAKACANHYRTVQVVKVKPNEKVADAIEACLKKILKKEKCAGIVVMSRRKKVAKVMNKLLTRYNKAEMMLLDEIWQLTPEDSPVPPADKVLENNKKVLQAEPPKQLAKPAEVPLLAPPKTEKVQAKTQPENRILLPEYLHNALNMLKKNRPRKKAALLQLLQQRLHLGAETAQALLDKLLEAGAVQLDATETVKYRF